MGNVITGNVVVDGVKNSYLQSDERLIVGIGIENMVIVETRDAILVSQKDQLKKLRILSSI